MTELVTADPPGNTWARVSSASANWYGSATPATAG
jgi:hypothetical protein